MQALCPLQAWLEEFLAKEKEVSGVKDEPKEADGEGEASTAAAEPATEPETASAGAAASLHVRSCRDACLMSYVT